VKRALMVLVALALLGACRKKVEKVRTPISQLDPLGGAAQAPPAPTAEAREGEPSPPQPAAQPTDGGVHKTVITAPKTTTTPSVASPYIPGGGSEHLPMWKQRAKFY
jgi:hypothetical protein